MAKKITDPDFNLGVALPEGVVNDYDLFYKPQKAPENEAVKSLITSLSNIVPTLANYDVGQEFKQKQKVEAQAVEDFNTNKMAFAQLVKNKKIPPGANPHYFNKMMELDLATKARDFEKKFNLYYAENGLKDKLSKDAFKDAYETQLKDFYNVNGLDKYDPLALNKAFFSATSKFRDDKEKTHEASRLTGIENQTQQLAIKNYAGGFIDLQSKNAPIEDVHKFIKGETDGYIEVTENPRMANELFLSGLQNYVDAVNSPEGFEYAKKIVDSLSTLKLGTGDFAGSNRAKFIQKKMQNSLLAKELQFLDQQTNYNKVKKDLDEQSLEDDYFAYKQNNRDFSITSLINTPDGVGEFAGNKYTQRQKDFLIKFHNGQQTALKLDTSTPDAIIELSDLQRENPYAVRGRALDLLNEGKLTITDYTKFSNSAGKYDVLENNVYFRKSRTFNNLRKFFDDPALARFPQLKTEIPLLRNDFENDVIEYWDSIKDQDISPREKQKKLDGEIKILLGEALQNSRIFSQSSTLLREITSRYGIPIVNTGGGS